MASYIFALLCALITITKVDGFGWNGGNINIEGNAKPAIGGNAKVSGKSKSDVKFGGGGTGAGGAGGKAGGRAGCGATKDGAPPHQQFNENKVAKVCDWIGHDIVHLMLAIGKQGNEGSECKKLCANRPGCTNWVWTQHRGGSCFLKTDAMCSWETIECTSKDAEKQDCNNSFCGIM